MKLQEVREKEEEFTESYPFWVEIKHVIPTNDSLIEVEFKVFNISDKGFKFYIESIKGIDHHNKEIEGTSEIDKSYFSNTNQQYLQSSSLENKYHDLPANSEARIYALFKKEELTQGIQKFILNIKIINQEKLLENVHQKRLNETIVEYNIYLDLSTQVGKELSKKLGKDVVYEFYKQHLDKIKNPVLRHRHEVVISWLKNLRYYYERAVKQDLLVFDKDIDKHFKEEADRKRSFLKMEAEYEFFDRKKIKNNEKIIRKYVDKNDGKEFLKKLLELYNNEGYTITQLSTSTKSNFMIRKIIGRGEYKAMKDEFFKNWKLGKTHGIGQAISHYSGELLTKNIEKKETKISRKVIFCSYCRRKFYPSIIAIDNRFNKYLPKGLNSLDVPFCAPCLESAFIGKYKELKNEKQMLEDIKKLTKILGYIPPFNYFNNVEFTKNLPVETFNKAVPILIDLLPYAVNYQNDVPEWLKTNCYKSKFGSWFKVLVDAGVLEGDVRKLGRGTMCLAIDGHQCLSMSEKIIDDWLFNHKIPHYKEIKYPKDEELNPSGLLRCDWKLKDNILVEFFGLEGQIDYDRKIMLKLYLCKKLNIKLIIILNKDLNRLADCFKNYSNRICLADF